MTSVWLVRAQHHEVPGEKISVHATEPSAEAMAHALTKMIIDDRTLRSHNWRKGLNAFKKRCGWEGDDEPYVEITELELNP